MRTLVVAVVVVAGAFWTAPAAHAADGDPPCMKDVANLCSMMPDMDGYLGTCLQGHWDDLSPECRKALNKDPDHEIKVRAACKSDKDRLCGDVLRGGAYNLECLAQHRNELSEKCRDALEAKPANTSAYRNQQPADNVEIITPKGSDLPPVESPPPGTSN